MTQHFFKRLYIGLLLAVGLIFVFSSPVFAGLMDTDAEISAFCDKWEVNLSDYSDQTHCWSCELFILLFDSANVVSGQINNVLSGSASKVVLVGGGLWLVFYTLAFLGNVAGDLDPMQYLTKVGTIMLRIGIASTFLAGGAAMAFDYFITPVLTTGAQLANVALSANGQSPLKVKMASDVTTNTGSPYDKMQEWVNGQIDRIGNQYVGAAAQFASDKLFGKPSATGKISGPMGDGVRNSLKQMIAAMASSMARAQAIAQGLRCGSAFWMKIGIPLPLTPDFIIPNPLMWIFGAWLGCVFWVVSFIFCFAMLDVIFRIGLIVSMLPVFIAAWVFPITGKFAKAAWDMFLNTVLVFFITGLTAAFIAILVEKTWGVGTGDDVNKFMDFMERSSYVKAWDSLSEGNNNGMATLFCVSCVSLWAWSMAPKADSLASKFVGGTFSSSVAIKAIKALIGFICDVVSLIITIITWGAASVVYLARFAKWIADTIKVAAELAEKIRKIKEAYEKLQKAAQKIKEAKEKLDKIKKNPAFKAAERLGKGAVDAAQKMIPDDTEA